MGTRQYVRAQVAWVWMLAAFLGLLSIVSSAIGWPALFVGLFCGLFGAAAMSRSQDRAAAELSVRSSIGAPADGRTDMQALATAHLRDSVASPEAQKAWTGPTANRDQLLAYMHSLTVAQLRSAIDHLTTPAQMVDPGERAVDALMALRDHVTGLAAANMPPDQWLARRAELIRELVEANDTADIHRTKNLAGVGQVLSRKGGRNA